MEKTVIFYQDTHRLIIKEEGKEDIEVPAWSGTKKYIDNIFAQGITNNGMLPAGTYGMSSFVPSKKGDKITMGKVRLTDINVPLNKLLTEKYNEETARTALLLHFASAADGNGGGVKWLGKKTGSTGCIVVLQNDPEFLKKHFGEEAADDAGYTATLTVTSEAVESGVVSAKFLEDVNFHVAQIYNDTKGNDNAKLAAAESFLHSPGMLALNSIVINSPLWLKSMPDDLNHACRKLFLDVYANKPRDKYPDISGSPEFQAALRIADKMRDWNMRSQALEKKEKELYEMQGHNASAYLSQRYLYPQVVFRSAEKNGQKFNDASTWTLDLEFKLQKGRLNAEKTRLIAQANNYMRAGGNEWLEALAPLHHMDPDERRRLGYYYYDELDDTARLFGYPLRQGDGFVKKVIKRNVTNINGKIYFSAPNEICVAPAGLCRGHESCVVGKYMMSPVEQYFKVPVSLKTFNNKN